MKTSTLKMPAFKLASISLMMLLTACSMSESYKREINGDINYLKTAKLSALSAPNDIKMPQNSGVFTLPPNDTEGKLGREIDIRPPQQPLAILDDSRITFSHNSATMIAPKKGNENLWSEVTRLLAQFNMPIETQSSSAKSLTTGLVNWIRKDEDNQYNARYDIKVADRGNTMALTVNLTELSQNGKNQLSDKRTSERYLAQMVNILGLGLMQLDQGKEVGYAKDNTALSVQDSMDDSSLPVLIVRAPYSEVWNRLPAAMSRIGMEINDSSRSKGSLKISYKPLSEKALTALKVSDPQVKSGDYTVQVGDLKNRSSLQFIAKKGKPLTVEQNKAMVQLFVAAFSPVKE